MIVARNILRWTAAGVAAHGARGREVMLALKGAADGALDLPILGPDKVIATAKPSAFSKKGKQSKNWPRKSP
nr:hypothetical protein [Geotalea toluenoxydans]